MIDADQNPEELVEPDFPLEEMAPCNDCGVPVFKGDLLCGPCFEKQREAEEWDSMNPENRCPPRE